MTSLERISTEVFYAFDQHTKRVRAPKNLASRLRGALTSVSRDFDEGMPLLLLPAVGLLNEEKHEPLSEACFEQFSEALKQHIDTLREKLEYRKKLANVKHYTLTELVSIEGAPSVPKLDDDRSLKTLLIHGHPFEIPFDEFRAAYDSIRSTERLPEVLSDPCKLIYRCYMRRNRRSKSGYPGSLAPLDKVFAKYYPTCMDQAAIALFIGLQTGWNKETIFALDRDKHENPLAGILNEKNVLIFSEKNKSQGRGKPFKEPKRFHAASSKADIYSAYNLIKLAKELSAPIADLPLDNIGQEYEVINPLFSCIRGINKMARRLNPNRRNNPSRPGRYTSVSVKPVWRAGIEEFFEKNEIYENGSRLARVVDVGQRLRPTWIRFVRDKHAMPLSVVALIQGHENIETTDVHYDDSGVARRKRRERLRGELESLMVQLRQKKFKGLIGKRSDTSLDFTSLRLFSLPGRDRALWACSDPYRPDWEGAPVHASSQKKCSEIGMCLFCSQVRIFEDSLPYLMDRQATLQRKQRTNSDSATEFTSYDELAIIDYIFDVWGNDVALKSAARYWRKNPDLLPSDMASLSLLFED
ncbi:hypothetical protein [Pseudomonas sp. OIL-1]|uniref:hypothetical protein n=1 Tax=Pseudomonas sp. OIL-1 TaxID=2706126 RepID=UPI0013A7922A|nr:hypothetical protein [Pseudomonas sp. OIL-1]QIB52414.1 hypothetical protein G3M63_16025 [Pseudomonas sp. OIL-1]